jgi:Holliday junction resolvase RusA-like endonuclease
MVQKPNDKRRRDLGNLEKVVSDFLKDMAIIEDDHLAESIKLEWRHDLPAPTVVVVTMARGATTEAMAPL